jgi:hypothetical protein
MAAKKSAQNPYQWPNGEWHSEPWAQHLGQIQGNAQAKNALMNYGRPGGPSSPADLPGFPGGPQEPFAGVDTSHIGAIRGAPSADSPASTPQPFDPALASTQIAANRGVAIGRSDAAYQQGNLGFDLGYNPDGTVNTANPYSRAALLQLSHEHDLAGANTSYAAQGQLYSGAYGRAKARADNGYAMNEAANRLAYQRGTHGIQTGLLNAAGNAGSAVSDADFNALLRQTYPGS